MGGNQALFQVALGLIPGLFFGGALLERRSELAKYVKGPPANFAVVVFVIAGVVAQIIAVKGTIDPNVTPFEQRFVVVVVVGGTVAIAVLTAGQWLSESVEKPRGRGQTVEEPRGRRLARFSLIAAVLAVVLAAIGIAQLAITASLNHASARDAWDVAAANQGRANEQWQTAERAANQARATLLSTVRTSSKDVRMRLTRAAVNLVEAIDEAGPQTLLVDRSPRRQSSILRGAARRIQAATDSFKESISRLRRGRQGEIELASLAAERLSTAEENRLAAGLAAAYVQERYRRACIKATALGCNPPAALPG